jgi:ABC-type nitrate/sulfonate/bicarbonate transport system substrate-binding protein
MNMAISGVHPRLAKRMLTVLMLALGSLLAGPIAAEDAGKLIPLRVHHYQGLFINQNTYIAYYLGFFKKHGLDVTLVPLPSGPAVEAAVHAGSVDVGSQDLDQTMVNTHVDNLNFTTICGAEGSYYQVVARPGLEISGPKTYPDVMKNFVGKRLGVTALGADTNYYWQALFQSAGLSPDSGTYVATGVGQQSLSALLHGLVDATMGFEPLTTNEVQNGATLVLNLAKGDGPPLTRNISPQLTYFVDKSFLATHVQAVTAFNEAIEDAVKFQRDSKNFSAVLGAMKQVMGPLAETKGFEQIVRDNIEPSSATAVTMQSVKAWLEFTKAYWSKFPKDVSLETIYKEVVWEHACK